MKKIFEDEFSEIQTDMIQICLEYVDQKADKIYIYGSFEDNTISCDFFYKIHDMVLERHQLNMLEEQYDVSIQRQKTCIEILNGDIKKLINACKRYNKDMPAEIKIIYDVKQNKVEARYRYGKVYSQYPDKTSDDIFEEWMQEIKK